MEAAAVIESFRNPRRLWSREELLARPSPTPAANGLYGWYFDELPHAGLGPSGTVVGPWSLLYIGIAPARVTSRSNLRTRLRQHLAGNARGSTLRLTLGAFLLQPLGLVPEAASGKLHFGASEALLSNWLTEHARVHWIEHPQPWLVEAEVVRTLNVSLNRDHNFAHPSYPDVGQARAALRALAASVVERPGG